MASLNLILVRHAEAAAIAPGMADGERPLTPTGEKVAGKAGRVISGIDLANPRIVCSPKLRTRQTAAILAATIDAPEPRKIDCLLGGRDPDAILERPRDGRGIGDAHRGRP